MKFQEAITSVINDFGKKILINSSLLNILNDYKAFSEEKHVKNVVKLLSEKGHFGTLYNISANDNYSIVINQISHELYNEYGINKDVSHSVLNSIMAGLGLGPVESMVDETLNQNSGFKIDDETQKRLDTYIDLLGASHRECGDLLSKQGKMEDAINFYKLGANRGDSQCLVFLVKLYIENSLVANERDAKDCCNRYFNSFLDVIGDGVPKLSEIEEEILDMYTKGFYEIIPVALQYNRTNIFHPNVEFFIIGALGTRLYSMLTKEMESVCNGLEKLNSKLKMGLLKMEDYPHYSSLQQKQESLKEFQTYLSSLIEKISKYEGQRMTLNRI